MKRKLTALLLTVIMAVSLAACGASESGSSAEGTAAETQTPAKDKPSEGGTETETETAAEPEPDKTAQTALPYRVLTGEQLTQEMGMGWNLGNTMDGHTGFTPNETLWQNVRTTKELMKAVHDLGFNTVRIPVTWGTMIDDENGYAIDEKWLGRVQDIVDYAIEQDMYVIVNIHHDGAEQSG